MPSAAKDSRARLLVYALLSHLLLLAHQAAYFGFTAPEAQSAAAWVNTYLAGGELGLEPGTAPAGLLSALLIVVVQLSGLDVELGLKLINVLAAHMLLLGLLLVSRTDAGARPFWTRLLAPAMLALTPALGVLSTNGLETTLFTLFVFLAMVRFGQKELRLNLEVAVWLLLATLTRPEGALYAAVALLWHLWRARADNRMGSAATWAGPALLLLVLGGTTGARIMVPDNPLPPLLWAGLPLGTSGAQTLTLENKGGNSLSVTVEVTDTADNLFVNGMLLDSVGWGEYTTSIVADASDTTYASLKVPDDYLGVGAKQGALVFWAEAE